MARMIQHTTMGNYTIEKNRGATGWVVINTQTGNIHWAANKTEAQAKMKKFFAAEVNRASALRLERASALRLAREGHNEG